MDQGILGHNKHQTLVPTMELAAQKRLLKQVGPGQQPGRQEGVDQLVVSQTLRLRCCLQVFVCDVQVAVP